MKLYKVIRDFNIKNVHYGKLFPLMIYISERNNIDDEICVNDTQIEYYRF